jgi:hypothetical protein
MGRKRSYQQCSAALSGTKAAADYADLAGDS